MSPGRAGRRLTSLWAGLIVTLVSSSRSPCICSTGSLAGRPVDSAVHRGTLQAAGGIARQHGELAALDATMEWPATCSPRRRGGAKLDTVATVLGDAAQLRRPRCCSTLTLITVALVVLALAGYLIAIAWALLDTTQGVAASCRRPRGGAGSCRAPCPRSSPPSTARWARCSAASRRPTAAWGERPRCSSGPDAKKAPCASRIYRSSSTRRASRFSEAESPTRTPPGGPRGAPDQLTAERIEELLERNGHIKDVDFDPGDPRRGRAGLPHGGRPPGPARCSRRDRWRRSSAATR